MSIRQEGKREILDRENLPNIWKRGGEGKSGKNGRKPDKENKSGTEGENQEGSFTLPLLTYIGLATPYWRNPTNVVLETQRLMFYMSQKSLVVQIESSLLLFGGLTNAWFKRGFRPLQITYRQGKWLLNLVIHVWNIRVHMWTDNLLLWPSMHAKIYLTIKPVRNAFDLYQRLSEKNPRWLCSQGYIFSKSVNFFTKYLFTTSLNFFPFHAHIFVFPSLISSPIPILAELYPYPKKQGICKNIYLCGIGYGRPNTPRKYTSNPRQLRQTYNERTHKPIDIRWTTNKSSSSMMPKITSILLISEQFQLRHWVCENVVENTNVQITLMMTKFKQLLWL